LLENTIRYKAVGGTGYLRGGDDDDRFITNRAATTAVALSNGQNDAGVFELNLHDERYLPFEGAGAISRWRIELNAALPDFDYESISDVILHVRYTARDGGARLKAAATKSLLAVIKAPGGLPLMDASSPLPLVRLFSLRHEFPSEWAALFRAAKSDDADSVVRSVRLAITKSRFPFFVSGASVQPQSVAAIAIQKGEAQVTSLPLVVKAGGEDAGSIALALQLVKPRFGGALFGKSGDGADLPKIQTSDSATWQLDIAVNKAQWKQVVEQVRDLFLIVEYTATFKA
jgi:hypothetical protein